MRRFFLAFAALLLALPAWAQPGPIPPSVANVSNSTVTATGGTTPRTLAARAADYYTPQDFSSTAGSGSDDSAAINAAITASVNAGGGTVFLPPPTSGAYNVCASTINLPLQTSLRFEGASAKTIIQILPGCGTPPASVLTLGLATGNSYSRIHLANLRVDAYCMAAHDLDVSYARGLTAENVVFRNSATGGSNVRIQNATQNGTVSQGGGWASFEIQLGKGNLIENVNDTGHTCYGSAAALPLYGLENWGSDNDFTGLTVVGAQTAYFYDGSTSGDNHFGQDTHGWGNTGLQATYAFWITSGDTIDGATADNYISAGIRVSGSNNGIHNVTFIASSTQIGILLDAGSGGNRITDNQLNWFSPTTAVVQTGGVIAASNIIQNNSGIGAAPSSENRIINGQFSVDQFHGGAQSTVLSTQFQDRWWISETYTQYWQVNPDDTGSGCTGAATGLVLVASGNTAITSGDRSSLTQPIDGADLQDLFMGIPAYAQGFEFSFWASASQAGQYSISFANGSQNRSLVATVNLTTSCQYYSLVIPPDVGGAGANSWNNTPGQGMMTANFDLGSGSTFQTSNVFVWQNGFFLEATGSVQLSQVSGGALSITAVRLRRGQSDVPYIPRSLFDEQQLARQFRQVTFPAGTAAAQNAGIAGALCRITPSIGAYNDVLWRFSPPLRKAPTITTYNPSAANASWRDVTASSDVAVSVDPSVAISANGVQITTSAPVITAGDNVCIHAVADVGY